jgi:hypothetical protein
MMKVLPESAVRHKMKSEGFSQTEIDSFFLTWSDSSGDSSSSQPPQPSSILGASAPAVQPVPSPLSPKPPPPLPPTDHADSRYEKFMKMLKLLPEPAVRHKMKSDGFTPEEIDNFMGRKYEASDLGPTVISSGPVLIPSADPIQPMSRPPPPPSQSPHTPVLRPPPPPPPKAINAEAVLPAGDAVDHRYEKFVKMVKMLPEPVVRHNMKSDGFSDPEINNFFKTNSEVADATVATQESTSFSSTAPSPASSPSAPVRPPPPTTPKPTLNRTSNTAEWFSDSSEVATSRTDSIQAAFHSLEDRAQQSIYEFDLVGAPKPRSSTPPESLHVDTGDVVDRRIRVDGPLMHPRLMKSLFGSVGEKRQEEEPESSKAQAALRTKLSTEGLAVSSYVSIKGPSDPGGLGLRQIASMQENMLITLVRRFQLEFDNHNNLNAVNIVGEIVDLVQALSHIDESHWNYLNLIEFLDVLMQLSSRGLDEQFTEDILFFASGLLQADLDGLISIRDLSCKEELIRFSLISIGRYSSNVVICIRACKVVEYFLFDKQLGVAEFCRLLRRTDGLGVVSAATVAEAVLIYSSSENKNVELVELLLEVLVGTTVSAAGLPLSVIETVIDNVSTARDCTGENLYVDYCACKIFMQITDEEVSSALAPRLKSVAFDAIVDVVLHSTNPICLRFAGPALAHLLKCFVAAAPNNFIGVLVSRSTLMETTAALIHSLSTVLCCSIESMDAITCECCLVAIGSLLPLVLLQKDLVHSDEDSDSVMEDQESLLVTTDLWPLLLNTVDTFVAKLADFNVHIDLPADQMGYNLESLDVGCFDSILKMATDAMSLLSMSRYQNPAPQQPLVCLERVVQIGLVNHTVLCGALNLLIQYLREQWDGESGTKLFAEIVQVDDFAMRVTALLGSTVDLSLRESSEDTEEDESSVLNGSLDVVTILCTGGDDVADDDFTALAWREAFVCAGIAETISRLLQAVLTGGQLPLTALTTVLQSFFPDRDALFLCENRPVLRKNEISINQPVRLEHQLLFNCVCEPISGLLAIGMEKLSPDVMVQLLKVVSNLAAGCDVNKAAFQRAGLLETLTADLVTIGSINSDLCSITANTLIQCCIGYKDSKVALVSASILNSIQPLLIQNGQPVDVCVTLCSLQNVVLECVDYHPTLITGPVEDILKGLDTLLVRYSGSHELALVAWDLMEQVMHGAWMENQSIITESLLVRVTALLSRQLLLHQQDDDIVPNMMNVIAHVVHICMTAEIQNIGILSESLAAVISLLWLHMDNNDELVLTGVRCLQHVCCCENSRLQFVSLLERCGFVECVGSICDKYCFAPSAQCSSDRAATAAACRDCLKAAIMNLPDTSNVFVYYPGICNFLCSQLTNPASVESSTATAEQILQLVGGSQDKIKAVDLFVSAGLLDSLVVALGTVNADIAEPSDSSRLRRLLEVVQLTGLFGLQGSHEKITTHPSLHRKLALLIAETIAGLVVMTNDKGEEQDAVAVSANLADTARIEAVNMLRTLASVLESFRMYGHQVRKQYTDTQLIQTIASIEDLDVLIGPRDNAAAEMDGLFETSTRRIESFQVILSLVQSCVFDDCSVNIKACVEAGLTEKIMHWSLFALEDCLGFTGRSNQESAIRCLAATVDTLHMLVRNSGVAAKKFVMGTPIAVESVGNLADTSVASVASTRSMSADSVDNTVSDTMSTSSTSTASSTAASTSTSSSTTTSTSPSRSTTTPTKTETSGTGTDSPRDSIAGTEELEQQRFISSSILFFRLIRRNCNSPEVIAITVQLLFSLELVSSSDFGRLLSIGTAELITKIGATNCSVNSETWNSCLLLTQKLCKKYPPFANQFVKVGFLGTIHLQLSRLFVDMDTWEAEQCRQVVNCLRTLAVLRQCSTKESVRQSLMSKPFLEFADHLLSRCNANMQLMQAMMSLLLTSSRRSKDVGALGSPKYRICFHSVLLLRDYQHSDDQGFICTLLELIINMCHNQQNVCQFVSAGLQTVPVALSLISRYKHNTVIMQSAVIMLAKMVDRSSVSMEVPVPVAPTGRGGLSPNVRMTLSNERVFDTDRANCVESLVANGFSEVLYDILTGFAQGSNCSSIRVIPAVCCLIIEICRGHTERSELFTEAGAGRLAVTILHSLMQTVILLKELKENTEPANVDTASSTASGSYSIATQDNNMLECEDAVLGLLTMMTVLFRDYPQHVGGMSPDAAVEYPRAGLSVLTVFPANRNILAVSTDFLTLLCQNGPEMYKYFMLHNGPGLLSTAHSMLEGN